MLANPPDLTTDATVTPSSKGKLMQHNMFPMIAAPGVMETDLRTTCMYGMKFVQMHLSVKNSAVAMPEVEIGMSSGGGRAECFCCTPRRPVDFGHQL